MKDVPRIGDLEIDQDLPFERREWTVQRIGWVVMLLVVAAALLGLLGPGPLTRLTAGETSGSLWVEYNRFERSEGSSDFQVNIGPGVLRGDQARVWVSRRYLEAIDLERVIPEPERVEAGPDRLTYVFHITDPGAPLLVRFRFRPERFWGHTARVGLEGGQEVAFGQFVYP